VRLKHRTRPKNFQKSEKKVEKTDWMDVQYTRERGLFRQQLSARFIVRNSRKPGSRKSRRLAQKSDKSLKQVLEKVEQERGNLMRADSLLSCLSIAMEYEPQSTKGPYYPDVAEIATEMLRGTINALDSVNLLDRKVREEFRVEIVSRAQLQLPDEQARIVESLPREPASDEHVPRGLQMRVHRRVYACDLARSALSGCS
jgi:hypothetical protein